MNIEDVLSTDWSKVDRKLKSSIREAGRSKGVQASHDAYCIAFLKWIEKRSGKDLGYENVAQKLMLEHDIDKLSADAVERAINSCGWNKESEPHAKKVFAEDALASYLLNTGVREGHTASRELLSLVALLLDIKPGESVVDFGCMFDSFLSSAAFIEPEVRLYGFNDDEKSAARCQMRTTVACSLSRAVGIARPEGIRAASAFDDVALQVEYDKAFSSYPFGLNLDDVKGDSRLLASIKKEASDMGMGRNADWAYSRLLISSIKEGGRAIGIMAGMSASHPSSRPAREEFIAKGWIEGAISLPAGTLARSGVSAVMVVLGRGSSSPRFVDASSLETLDEESVSRIASAWRDRDSRCGISATSISVEDLAKRGYELDPSKLLTDVRSGVKLTTLSKGRIRRGMALSAEEVGDASEGQYLYLNNSDLIGGRIAFPLKSRPAFDDAKEVKAAVRDGDLLISRAGFPLKVAVAEGLGGRSVVPCNNLYSITLDKDEMDPWYAAAFLDSELGRNALRLASTGASTQILALDALGEVEIPKPSMDEQRRVAGIWKSRMARIAEMKKEINRASAHLHDGLWDESGRG